MIIVDDQICYSPFPPERYAYGPLGIGAMINSDIQLWNLIYLSCSHIEDHLDPSNSTVASELVERDFVVIYTTLAALNGQECLNIFPGLRSALKKHPVTFLEYLQAMDWKIMPMANEITGWIEILTEKVATISAQAKLQLSSILDVQTSSIKPSEALRSKPQSNIAEEESRVRLRKTIGNEHIVITKAVQNVAVRLDTQHLHEAEALRQSSANAAKASIERQFPGKKVSLDLAKAVIRSATWWNTHSSGYPVLASAFAYRITGTDGDWRVKFGANSFLVGRAIANCIMLLCQYIDRFESGSPSDPEEVIDNLRAEIRKCVAAYNDTNFDTYPIIGNDMHFGAHSIDLKYFIKALLDTLPSEVVHPLQKANGTSRR